MNRNQLLNKITFLHEAAATTEEAIKRLMASQEEEDDRRLLSEYQKEVHQLREHLNDVAGLFSSGAKHYPQKFWDCINQLYATLGDIHHLISLALANKLSPQEWAVYRDAWSSFVDCIKEIYDVLTVASIKTFDQLIQYLLAQSDSDTRQYGLNLASLVNTISPILNKYRPYAVIGGFGVLLHLCGNKSVTEQIKDVLAWRGTKDIDVLVSDHHSGAIKHDFISSGFMYQSQAWMNSSLDTFTSDDVQGVRVQIQLRTEHLLGTVDMAPKILSDAISVTFFDQKIMIPSLKHMISLKKAVQRDKDKFDLQLLKRL